MHQLQVESSKPPDAAVRTLWVSLTAADRLRFSSEFPQFMHYVVGLPAQAEQAGTRTPHTTAAAATTGGAATAAQPRRSVGSTSSQPQGTWSSVDCEQREAKWASRVTFHGAVLRVAMQTMRFTDADLALWCTWAPSV